MKYLLLISCLILCSCKQETYIGHTYKVKTGFYKDCTGVATEEFMYLTEIELRCNNMDMHYTTGTFTNFNLEEVK